MLGGVSPNEVATCIAVLTATVLATGALGLAASSLAGKTSAASAGSYATVGFFMVGLPVLLYLTEQARVLNSSGSELGIAAMLAAYTALTFAPGAGMAVVLLRLLRMRTGRPAERPTWLLVGGLSWCAMLATLYLPGADEILNNGSVLMGLHPVMVILHIMSDQSGAAPTTGFWSLPSGSLWMLSVMVSLLVAAWCFQIAVLRVRGLRAG
jgi:hypothetical protein